MTRTFLGAPSYYDENDEPTNISENASDYMTITAIRNTGVRYDITDSPRDVPNRGIINRWEIQLKPEYRFRQPFNGHIIVDNQRRFFSVDSTGTFASATGPWDASKKRTGMMSEIYIVDWVPVITVVEETHTEEIPIPETEYRETSELLVGEERTVQDGAPGEYTITEEVTYGDRIEMERVEIGREITTEPKPTIIEQGTTIPVEPPAPTQDVNDITIPYIGRNHLRNTGVGNSEPISMFGAQMRAQRFSLSTEPEYYILESTVSSGEVYYRAMAQGTIPSELSGTWTFSGEVLIPEGTSGIPLTRTQVAITSPAAWVNSYGNGERPINATKGVWTKFVHTFEMPEGTQSLHLGIKFANDTQEVGDKIHFKNFKLERGNVATDWVPAVGAVVYSVDGVVVYSVDGVPVEGTITITEDTTIQATAREGYRIIGDSEWTFEYQPTITTEEETKYESIPQPETEYQETKELEVGKERTIQEGQAGEYTIVELITYADGVEVDREEISRDITTEALPTIIEQGTLVVTIEQETRYEEVPIPRTEYQQTDELLVGEERTIQEGTPGEYTIIDEVRYEDGVETDRKEISREVTTEPLPKIIEQGTTILVEPPKPEQDVNNITIPPVDVVTYSVNGESVTGTIIITEDTTIKAVAKKGYRITGDSEWTFEYHPTITTDEETRTEVIEQPEDEYLLKPEMTPETQITAREGHPGEYTITERVTYADGVEIEREEIDRQVTTEPVATLIEHGPEWTTLTKEDVTRPTQDGNWITIPRGTESYGYYDKETGEPWGRGNYYTLVDRVVEVKSLKHDVRFEEGMTTVWTMKYTPEDRTIYTNYFILDPDLYINDNPIKDKTNRGLDTRHDVIIEYRVDPDGYKRIDTRQPGSIRVNGKNYSLEVNEEGTIASITYSGDDNYSITLSAPSLVAKPVTVTYHGRNATLEVMLGHSVNYSLRGGESVELPGDRYADFWVRADEGYYFTTYGTLEHGSDTIDVPVRSDTENTVARISINSLRYDSILTMGAVTIAEMVPTDVLGFNNIYLVTKDTLSDISLDIFRKRRSYYVTDPDGHRDIRWDPYVATDPHTYIINTIQLPIKVDENVLGPDVPIELGFTKLLTNAPMLTRDKLTVDLGEIKVPNTYNNTYDYKGTEILIHLPYHNPITVEPNYVIGETILVEYIIDLYTGETTINLKSTFVDDKVFYSTTTLMGNVVPFITIKDATTIGSPRESRSVIHNNTPTPYVEVIRKRPYQLDSQFNTDIRTTVDNLQNVTGNIYVHDIHLNIDTTQSELSNIKSILSGGITIK